MELGVESEELVVGSPVPVVWNVFETKTNKSSFQLDQTTPLINKSTMKQATIIHSNVHACTSDSKCDPFNRQYEVTAPTQNQVGNLSMAGTSFSSSELTFTSPGKYLLLAHVIVPGETLQSRYDFAVYMTIDIGSGEDQASVDQPSTGARPANTASGGHGMSMGQVITISGVGLLVLVLALMGVIIKQRMHERQCRSKRQHSDPTATQLSVFSPFNLMSARTTASDFPELRGDEQFRSPSYDDRNTLAMLRGSDESIPRERTVADFRKEVARWDIRSSASPITPSSSAILIAMLDGSRESDTAMLSTTPATDCFVPLEHLVPESPRRTPTCRPGSSRYSDLSEDEREVDM
ncbi:hypothetical protein Poli38472_005397 [Pythium oligandrum]|uniref:Uncharacterized protein n=1 Tax=Pythium oligandrum TaxID=41045 RepID=A0A8K1CGT5_PYTOL|nr:hypothetical protein Poli38472_005397 [Pythium oligandrum]|eukprot:TMW62779.1 hypothetical protein Poli38472_005397 [Pythium oligandrum]